MRERYYNFLWKFPGFLKNCALPVSEQRAFPARFRNRGDIFAVHLWHCETNRRDMYIPSGNKTRKKSSRRGSARGEEWTTYDVVISHRRSPSSFSRGKNSRRYLFLSFRARAWRSLSSHNGRCNGRYLNCNAPPQPFLICISERGAKKGERAQKKKRKRRAASREKGWKIGKGGRRTPKCPETNDRLFRRPFCFSALLGVADSAFLRQVHYTAGPVNTPGHSSTVSRKKDDVRGAYGQHRASSFVSRPGSSSIRLIFTSRMCTGSERACLLVHFRTINSVILKWILGRRRACCDLKGTHCDCWDRVNPRMLKNPPRIIQVLEIPKFIFHNISLNSI